MQRITLYQSKDGKLFSDKKLCREYDKQLRHKLSKKRLIELYSLLMSNLFYLATYCNSRNICSANQYRQKLQSNRDTWDYLSVKEGLSKYEFYQTYQQKLYGYTTLYLDPDLTIKELVEKAKSYLPKS
jgi:hypothetical protein